MLLLLRDVLQQFKQAVGLPSLPLPCEYFDIIAGSGTGGFIALLLGRLRLSIENALECYVRVVDHVFAQIKAGGNFKVTPFEKVLKEISNRFGEGEDTPILDSHSFPCKTFVCIRENNGSGNTVFRKIRTYARTTEPTVQCTLLEAVRATMSNPAFFKPLSVQNGRSSVTLLDAGDQHYNPVFDLYEEALFFYPTREVAYFLSLGPGKADTVGVNPPRRFVNQPRLPPSVISTLRRLADCCDHTASAFQAENGDFDNKYFRLSPAFPSYDEKIRWEQEEVLEELISPYLTAVYELIMALVLAMMNERAARHGSSR